jgi:hypothetical protein
MHPYRTAYSTWGKAHTEGIFYMTKFWSIEDPIPCLWQQREQLKPFYDHYGAHVLGKALAKQYALETSRTACHHLAALLTPLTDFREWYDYADFYVSFDAEEPAVTACLRELQGLNLW